MILECVKNIKSEKKLFHFIFHFDLLYDLVRSCVNFIVNVIIVIGSGNMAVPNLNILSLYLKF